MQAFVVDEFYFLVFSNISPDWIFYFMARPDISNTQLRGIPEVWHLAFKSLLANHERVFVSLTNREFSIGT